MAQGRDVVVVAASRAVAGDMTAELAAGPGQA